MDRRARLVLGLLLLALGVAAILGWVWRAQGVHADRSGTVTGGAGPGAMSGEHAASGPSALEPAPAATRIPRAVTAPPALASGARIHGRVTVAGSAGPLPEGSHVDVCALDADAETLIRRARLEPDGRFEVTLEEDIVPALRAFVVYAAVPGWAWRREVVRLGPGREVALDSTLGGPGHEAVLRVRVIDPVGRPVAGLRLLITSNPVRSRHVPLPDPEADGYQVDRSYSIEGVVTTDGDGRFELRGHSGQRRSVDSLDGAWHVVDEVLGHARGRDETLRVQPGYVLEGRVADAVTGAVLETIDQTQQVRVGGRILDARFSRRGGGRFRSSRPLPAGAEAGFDLVVRATAEGHRRADRTVPFRPGHWTQRLDLALERSRADDTGRLRLVHRIRDASGRPLGIDALWWEDMEGTRRAHRLEVEYDADGLGTVELPSGRAHIAVTLRSPDGLGTLVRWDGVADVDGARTSDLSVPFPETGTLRVRVPGGEGGMLRVVDARDEKRWLSRVAAGDTLDLPWVPVGPWDVYMEGWGRDSAARADVTAGGIAEVALRP